MTKHQFHRPWNKNTSIRYAVVIKKKLDEEKSARIRGDYDGEGRDFVVALSGAAVGGGSRASLPRRRQARLSGVSGKCWRRHANIHYFLFFFFCFFKRPQNLIQWRISITKYYAKILFTGRDIISGMNIN